MARRIVPTGRGGAGKSTLVALASKYLNPPKLLIDLDPDEILADMVGLDLSAKEKKTISSALYDVIEEIKGQAAQAIISYRMLCNLFYTKGKNLTLLV